MAINVDLPELYRILVRIAESNDTITYEDLSQAYKVQTGDDIHRRQWGEPLGNVSARCTDSDLPPISSVVVSATDGLPGDGYWGIVGAPPSKDYNGWKAVCALVHAAVWPKVLP
jgi:hypothetical protein